MYRFTAIATFALLLACSQESSHQDKLKASIKQFIDKNAHDPSSYEPGETISVDTFFTESKQPCAYEFIHTCRIKNAMGALNKQEYYVQTDTDLNVINMVSERKKRFNTPCKAIENRKSQAGS